MSTSSTPPSPSDSAETLLRHFPAEVRETYQRFQSGHRAEDADCLVLAVVRDHIPEKARRASAALADHEQLIADLGFDSVAITEMVFFLEDLFRVRIANEEILRVRTVGDLRTFVREKLAASASSASA